VSAERPLIPPEQVRSNSYPSEQELKALGAELREFGVSFSVRVMMAQLAARPPRVRLAANLKTVVSLMAKAPVYNILTEGLTPEEHAALVELDMRGLSIGARQTAHGLLNVHERWTMLRSLRRLFKQAPRKGYLTPRSEESNGSKGTEDS